MDALLNEIVYLALIVGVKHEVKGQPVLDKPLAKAIPDSDNLRIVGDGAQE
jgi:hypothetical protein